jgi:transposase
MATNASYSTSDPEGLSVKESLDRLWPITMGARRGATCINGSRSCVGQRLKPFGKFAKMLLRHDQGLLNYCHAPVRFGVVEAVNGNIRALIRRGRGYKNLRYGSAKDFV